MRILLLSQWYAPEPTKLFSDMAESLSEMGHEVQVLTGFPNYPEGTLYPGYRIQAFRRDSVGGVPVIRVALFPDHSNSGPRRALNFASFVASAATFGGIAAARPDIIHAIQPPTTCAAAWFLSRMWRVPFTYDLQDMWPETLRATGFVRSEPVLAAVDRYCRWSYARAAGVRVISQGFRTHLIEKGVSANKVTYIPNWVDTDYYAPRERDETLAREWGMVGRFNVVYAGTIGPAQGLGVVLDAADLLRDNSSVQFVLAGEGLELQKLREDAIRRRLRSVRFLGRRPMSEMPALYSLADVLLVHLKDDALFRMTVPHKTLTYLAAAKPVIAAVGGDVDDLVRTAQCGVTCRPSDPVALARAVEGLSVLGAPRRRALGEAGRRIALAQFGRRQVVGELATFLRRAIACPRGEINA